MSGRIKGIVLNFLIVGSGFMAQGRWGWGFFYLIIAIALGAITFGLGYFVIAPIAMIHSGLIGDAAKKDALTQKDIERLASAMKESKKD